MASIDARLTRLIEAMEREKLREESEIDDLSLSLYQLEDEMAAMTEADIEAMAAKVDADEKQMLTLEQAYAFVDEWRQRRSERSPRAQRRIDRALATKWGG